MEENEAKNLNNPSLTAHIEDTDKEALASAIEKGIKKSFDNITCILFGILVMLGVIVLILLGFSHNVPVHVIL